MKLTIDDLAPAPYNPRRNMTEKEKAGLAASLQRYGDISGITYNLRTRRLVGGHKRVARLRELGAQVVDGQIQIANGQRFPIRVIDVPESEEKEINVTANNRHIAADFDERLAPMLGELEASLGADAFGELALDDLRADLDKLGDGDGDGVEVEQDDVPEPPAEPTCQLGDVWALGEHRLYCADNATVQYMGSAALVFTSPPYASQRSYGEHSTHGDWLGMMKGAFDNLRVVDDAQILVNLDLVHTDGEWQPYWEPWIEAMRDAGWRRFGLYVWDQGAGLAGALSGQLAGRFVPSYELVFHFNTRAVIAAKWVECVNAGNQKSARTMRNASGDLIPFKHDSGVISTHKVPDNVIRITRQSGGSGDHPAPFPVALPEYIIMSWPGDICDPFAGSGTTLIAAEQLGRVCHAVEIEPRYCDVIIERWENLTGGSAKKVSG